MSVSGVERIDEQSSYKLRNITESEGREAGETSGCSAGEGWRVRRV